jgi:hypothetical protein
MMAGIMEEHGHSMRSCEHALYCRVGMPRSDHDFESGVLTTKEVQCLVSFFITN